MQGSILFDRGDGSQSVDLATVDPNGEMIRSIRGNEIAMIFQEPLTSLSPVHTVGSQIAEAVELHQNVYAGRGPRARHRHAGSGWDGHARAALR